MHRRVSPGSIALSLTLALVVAGCIAEGEEPLKIISNAKVVPAEGAEQADDAGPAKPIDPEALAKKGGPELGVTAFAVRVYERPDPRSTKLGYVRIGERLVRGEKPAAYDACQGGFYSVLPRGFVCLDDGATIDMEHPIMRAKLRGPDRSKAMPYTYAFVRAIAPRYYRLPTVDEQFKYEMSLKRHLRSYRRLKDKWNRAFVGANDLPIDEQGRVLGPAPSEAPEMSDNVRFGGVDDGAVPWFFENGRQIPNVSTFKVPDYAVITNRIKRHAGVALLDAFQGDERHFALTTDLRLVPTSKLKPGRGSTFHGVELGDEYDLPVAFVKRDGAYRYKRKSWKRKKKTRLAYGKPVQLTGNVRRSGKRRYVETEDGDWMRSRDLAIVAKQSKLPRISKKASKWIDVSIQRQTLVLFEGTTPVFATMVSTGKDGLGNPRKTHSTPRGTFRIRDKHVTDTMDSDVLGSAFELNDVPWVQYFKAGYAIHAAYWHTEYGRPRSHGCINMSPLDAYRVFGWTEPKVPAHWHGTSAGESMGEGTFVHIHP
jgi:lipoprotein-anchoring transpeptidase ErfK/SrfK